MSSFFLTSKNFIRLIIISQLFYTIKLLYAKIVKTDFLIPKFEEVFLL